MLSSARAGRSRSSAKTKTAGEPRYWLFQREEQAEETFMTSAAFDFAPLLPTGSPAPAARWTAHARIRLLALIHHPELQPAPDRHLDAHRVILRDRTQPGP